MKYLSICIILIFTACIDHPQILVDSLDGRDVVIYRDKWGVPHIFGKTDADAAFGLAYANAEDDFDTILFSLLAAKGKLAEAYGKKYAPNDYIVQLFKLRTIVDEKYKTDISLETRKICESYAAGINHYINTNRIKIPAAALPIQGKDLISGFVHKLPFFFGIHKAVEQVMNSNYPIKSKMYSAFPEIYGNSFGSNVFAVSPSLTSDGHTRLMSNTHQPWEGPTAWYEAHIHSEEGWNAVGGLFHGSPVILVGHNDSLGWSHTVNSPDLIDVYKLEINPENSNQYRFDDKWLNLDPFKISFKIQFLNFINLPYKIKAYWSVHGPVVENNNGEKFAIRYAGHEDIRALEQWFKMNKAHNFEQWEDAMEMTALPMFNTGYADRDGNIFYTYNARLPKRAAGYDWIGVLPGNTSETLWENYLLFSELPQLKNPESGFIQNCNSSPFKTTIGDDNPSQHLYPENLGIEKIMTNRALRALELFGSNKKISSEEFEAIKYDLKYSEQSNFAKLIQRTTNINTKDSLGILSLKFLREWNLETNKNNTHTAFAIYSLINYIEHDPNSVDLDKLHDHIILTAKEFINWFGRLDVPWGDVNRLIRGESDFPVAGGPDIIRAIYGSRYKDGRQLKGTAGDCYVIYADWDKFGKISSKSIHQYGTSQNKKSPHFSDQSNLFVNQKMKPIYFSLEDIIANLDSSYVPRGKYNIISN